MPLEWLIYTGPVLQHLILSLVRVLWSGSVIVTLVTMVGELSVHICRSVSWKKNSCIANSLHHQGGWPVESYERRAVFITPTVNLAQKVPFLFSWCSGDSFNKGLYILSVCLKYTMQTFYSVKGTDLNCNTRSWILTRRILLSQSMW